MFKDPQKIPTQMYHNIIQDTDRPYLVSFIGEAVLHTISFSILSWMSVSLLMAELRKYVDNFLDES